MPAETTNTMDLDPAYHFCLWKHCLEAGMESFKLELGKVAGDLLLKPLKQLKVPCDFLVSGPPCPPWAGQGNRRSLKDSRARVFIRILTWVLYLVHCGGLLAVAIENVVGISQSQHNCEPVLDMFLRAMNKFVPEFVWGWDKLHLRHYMCPQLRVRIILKGMRRTICNILAPPLPGFGERGLREALGKFPNTPLQSLSQPQQQNHRDYEEIIRTKFAAGLLDKTDVVMFAIDRAKGRAVNQHIYINVSGTLTCHNRYLWVEKVGDIIDEVPCSEREYSRFLKNPERLALQGFEKELALQLTPSKAFKAAGNAYPVPLMAAALSPMVSSILEAVAKNKFNFVEWPPQRVLKSEVPQDLLQGLQRALLAKPKPKAASKGKAKTKAPWTTLVGLILGCVYRSAFL